MESKLLTKTMTEPKNKNKRVVQLEKINDEPENNQTANIQELLEMKLRQFEPTIETSDS